VVVAAWFLGIPILIHQQDLLPGLANKICAPFATAISVTFSENLNDYSKKKTFLTGNPVRKQLRKEKESRGELLEKLNLKSEKPILLIVGGGTGAQAINDFVWNNLDDLTEMCQVVHLTGKGKSKEIQKVDYRQFEYLKEDLIDYYFVTDLALSRAGLSFLTELSFLKKATIVVPIPDSHQEKNAEYFADKGAVTYLKQKELGSGKVISEIKDLLKNDEKRKKMTENMHNVFGDFSGNKIVDKIFEIVEKNK